MSYDIALTHPVTGEVLILDHKHGMAGGTYELGGTNRAHLNVTYNYAEHFRRAFGDDRGVRSIYGLTGGQSMPVLNAAIGRLGTDVDADYWKPTEGNARVALCQLLALAWVRPDGVWSGD